MLEHLPSAALHCAWRLRLSHFAGTANLVICISVHCCCRWFYTPLPLRTVSGVAGSNANMRCHLRIMIALSSRKSAGNAIWAVTAALRARCCGGNGASGSASYGSDADGGGGTPLHETSVDTRPLLAAERGDDADESAMGDGARGGNFERLDAERSWVHENVSGQSNAHGGSLPV